ncbi:MULTISPECIES: glycosyltransferase family 2 protein [Moorena]|uniref:Glycosyltransferase involved in cell wall biogenesis n=1 Tax=Moorena producens 3L TaxID=489825 RepID=F4XKM7_9CYAN|nr:MULTISPECIES: glycosyltransferase family 2 protein [Moorena]NEQ13646.1 glycosyltransferase family 2 protein [Moorena sp. SIO3E2]NES82042.1 glycosyltransferase family 2 protein [Moorena sp. SIO2B7]EGJ34882.1 glycosyltransferase involved in cell wall biogenesis [Moorena producens 3L]NEP31993.1 glycosyltransferase family 2 protein [Moorena sp. SIO3B2]NEP68463.1 glycosyltransferase family 2 protein [Moorena sp. SIO3A5]
MKTVSIIIPVYGVEKYIASAVQSVINQNYQNFELLIIDDESPDSSIKICQEFSDHRLKIIHQTNRGLAGARNTGIRHAKGDYLAFLDGDDLWLPQKLERHIEHLEKFPEVGVSFCRSALIDEAGNFMGAYLMPKLTNITISDLFRESPIGNGSAAVVRREVFDKIKYQDNLYGPTEDYYFDENFRRAEDIECWLRIAIQTDWKIEGIPEALTLYRINTQGLSANLFKQFESLEQMIEKTRSYAPKVTSRWENISRAYQLRYLARSAVRLKVGSDAVTFIHRSLSNHWLILLEQPQRTILTLIAAYMLWLLPKSLYAQIELLVSKLLKNVKKQPLVQN